MVQFLTFNLARITRPVTYQDENWRFELLVKILKLAFFRILRRDLDLGRSEDGDEETYKSLYYERLYDIQNGPENYFEQLSMTLWAIRDAYYFNRTYAPRNDAGNVIVALVDDDLLIGLRHVVEDGIQVLSGEDGDMDSSRQRYVIRHLGDLFYTACEGFSVYASDAIIVGRDENTAIETFLNISKFVEGKASPHWQEILPSARDTFNALKFDEDVPLDARERTCSLLRALLAGVKRAERSGTRRYS